VSQYLTTSEFQSRTLLPAQYIDQVVSQAPEFVDFALTDRSGYIDSLLGKRYAVPFVEQPYPSVILRWLTVLVSLDVYMKRGFNPTDDDAQLFVKQFDTTVQELKEAANAQDGLYELPLRQDLTGNGIVKGYARTYSETSPFVWKRIQRQIGGQEDTNGRGTRYGKR
jgi:phage gp36-like protein